MVEVVLVIPPDVHPSSRVGGDAEAVPARRDVNLPDAEDGAMLVVAWGVPRAPPEVTRVIAELVEHVAIQLTALEPSRPLALVRDGHRSL